MIRLTGGEWRGQTLEVPPGIRPTTDRVRKAAFDLVGARVALCRVLDAAAGSGGYGLEALSRGAAFSLFIERDRRAAAAIGRNVQKVGAGERATVRQEGVASFLAWAGVDGRRTGLFDVVFHDPPYADEAATDLEGLFGLLAPGGILIQERGGTGAIPVLAIPPHDVRRYGGTRLLIWHLRD